jgi:hypothetical protein
LRASFPKRQKRRSEPGLWDMDLCESAKKKNRGRLIPTSVGDR